MSDHDEEHRPVRRVLWARLLLILPFIALLWILIGAALIAFVYAVER
jgi:hypothetical protein